MQMPHVQFARMQDGVTIAYRCEGQGPAIAFLPGWVSHLESESTDAAKAKPGTILVSDVVRQLAAGKPFRFADRGRARLKGLQERLRLFEVTY
jgi:hypothetical protein